MKEDAFEQKLADQTMQPLPEGWRDEILGNAGAVVPKVMPSKKSASVRLVTALMGSKPFLIALTGFMLAGTVGAFVIGFEGQRAQSKMAKLEEMLAAEGESLSLEALLPEAVPDDQNFMVTPALRGIEVPESMDPDGEFRAKRDYLNEIADMNMNFDGGDRSDFAELRYRLSPKSEELRLGDLEGDPLENFMTITDAYEDLIAELVEVSRRPYSQPAYSIKDLLGDNQSPYELSVPHYRPIQGLGKLLVYRSEAEAKLGRSERYVDESRTVLKLGEGTGNTPMLIAHLVELAVYANFFDSFDVVLRFGGLTDGQLVELAEMLESIDILERSEYAYRGEIAMGTTMIDRLLETPRGDDKRSLMIGSALSGENLGEPSVAVRIVSYLIPDSLIVQNKATAIDWQYRYVLKPLKERDFDAIWSAEDMLGMRAEDARWSAHAAFAKLAVPVLGGAVQRSIDLEARRQMAIVAIELERERLKRGDYPDAVDVGEPVLGKLPLRYSKTDDGYLLYCDGWNAEDDGGDKDTDWVWGEG